VLPPPVSLAEYWRVIFRKIATNYRAHLRKMTCEDKASYESTPPWNWPATWGILWVFATLYSCIAVAKFFIWNGNTFTYTYLCMIYIYPCMYIYICRCVYTHISRCIFPYIFKCVYINTFVYSPVYIYPSRPTQRRWHADDVGWLWLVGSLKL